MKRSSGARRPAVNISLARAARLHRLVAQVADDGQTREQILGALGVGLRTFYRELELLRRCGVKIRLDKRRYVLQGTPEEAAGRLPFPDPQLSFAEMAELATCPGAAGQRLAALLESVVTQSDGPRQRTRRTPARRPQSGSSRGSGNA